MTNGSCQSTVESKVQPWVNPRPSASFIRAITVWAGGSVCKTRPKSMIAPYDPAGSSGSAQVLAGLPVQELAVARPALILPGVDDDVAPRQHRVHPPGDLHTLVGRVVHVHVV